MRNLTLLLGGVFLLSACGAPVPDSGAKVNSNADFSSYQDLNSYRANRETALLDPIPSNSGGTRSATTPIAEPTQPPVDPDAGNLTEEEKRQIILNNPSISDEQDFTAVSDRESIQSDAERLQAQREAFQVIEPEAVPRRSGASGPNIVQYAITTRNPVGQKVYRRGFPNQSRFERNCAKYKSPDLAQEAFLAAGGPQRDKFGIDPDGDGFACSWDPRPFRAIQRG